MFDKYQSLHQPLVIPEEDNAKAKDQLLNALAEKIKRPYNQSATQNLTRIKMHFNNKVNIAFIHKLIEKLKE